MEKNELELLVMQLIMNSGDARSCAMEAIQLAKQNDFDAARDKIKDAENSIHRAHEIQTQMLTQEARGENLNFSLLLTHSQDHLMGAIMTIDLAKEMISLWAYTKKIGGEENV